jgi:hypothetical protein
MRHKSDFDQVKTLIFGLMRTESLGKGLYGIPLIS